MRIATLLFLGCCACAATVAGAGAAGLESVTLPSGLTLVHGENRASGLVSLAVIVRAGAAWESAETNGAAHFLEHLLFNGTTQRTQEELYRDIDLLGAYANATTRRDHVVYLLVCAAEDLQPGLEILGDMLFHSTLPADKFEKERGIIIEEIGKDHASPDDAVQQVVDATLGHGSAYARPVLGTVASIEAMQRDDVLAYYERFYVPANMVLLATGAVTLEAVEEAVGRVFPAGGEGQQPAAFPERPPLRAQVSMARQAADRSTVVLALPAGDPESADAPAVLLLEEMLNGEGGRLRRALRREPRIEVTDVGASVVLSAGSSRLEIQAHADSTVSVRALAARLFEALADLAGRAPDGAEVEAARTRRVVDEALLADQIHYMAFMRASSILHAPLWLLAGTEVVYDSMTGEHVQALARRLLAPESAAEMVAVGPRLRARVIEQDPRRWVREEAGFAPAAGGRRAAGPAAAEDAGAAGGGAGDGTAAAGGGADRWADLPHDPAPARTRVAHAPRRVVLANGLTVVLSANPDSRVLAIHLAARGRSYREPAGKAGMVDLLHRLLPLGAGPWSREQVGRLLDRAGVRLKVTDSAWIPYDDYYTTNDYSYVRLETIDRFYRETLALLAAMAREPRLAEEDLETVRGEAVVQAERRARSTRERSKALLRAAQWPDSPGALPALGTVESLRSIGIDDLRALHTTYFAPSNLVLTVVTGIEPEVMLAAIEDAFGAEWPAAAGGPPPPIPPPPITTAPREVEESLGSGQVYIRLGSVFDLAADDAAALAVAVGLLSDRMAFELREQQGLAYSIGAGLGRHGDRARLVAWMGTRPENVGTALQGMRRSLHGFTGAGVDASDIRKVVKSRVGRLRMRQVARIGQAYALATEELEGKAPGSSRAELDRQLEVGTDDVSRVATRHLVAAPLVQVVVR